MKFIFLLIIGAGVTACSFHLQSSITASQQKITSENAENCVEIDSLVAPYKREMETEFSQVIGNAKTSLLTNRNSMTLGFWICDELIEQTRDTAIFSKQESLLSILNFGGLRADIPVGKITIGTIYKVMPFDNHITYLKLSTDKLSEIELYMKERGGEPIGGFRITQGKIVLNDSIAKQKGYFWVVTTDFLANGGDKMTFFVNPLERIDSPLLLRDFILNRVKLKVDIGCEDSRRIDW